MVAIEKKFKGSPEFEKQYKDFMQEYERLGHEELVQQNYINNCENEQYFLSHHAVKNLIVPLPNWELILMLHAKLQMVHLWIYECKNKSCKVLG